MSFLPPTAKLSNPTHRIVGPDGTEYFLIRRKGNSLRIRILFAAPNWVDTTPAGSVSEGWGPSGADDILMGRWTGILAHHFTNAAIEALPDGAHCEEINPEPSPHDYETQVLWSGWTGRDGQVAFRRAKANRGAYTLPVTRPQREAARPLLEAHLAALRDGSYRRADGPMVPNPAPPEPGKYHPTYVQAEGTSVPPDLLPEFIADAERALAYLDFLDSIPDLPERPRRA